MRQSIGRIVWSIVLIVMSIAVIACVIWQRKANEASDEREAIAEIETINAKIRRGELPANARTPTLECLPASQPSETRQ